MSVLTALPPAVAFFAVALLVAVLPRRLGHALGAIGLLATVGWTSVLPLGPALPATLLGFDAVLLDVTPVARLLGMALGVVGAAALGYSYASGANTRQSALAVAYLGAGAGAAFAGDWLTLILCWELMALFATVLIWHHSSDRAAGFRYGLYHELGGLALIAGVLLHYAQAGTFVYGDGITGGLPALLVALGVGLNVGFVGMHVWLVDAYPKAHVATSVVLAAVTTKVGAVTLVRAFPTGRPALVYVGVAMVLVGVTFAVLQTDMRRLLSYHIVSQVGYVVVGFGLGSAFATAAGVAHLVNNVLYKSLLFMVAGVLVQRTGTENLKKLGTDWRAMPLTAAAFAVAALSITGVPGFNGFVSKGMVLDAVQKAHLDVLWWALLAGSVGTVVSFAKFGYYAFLHGDDSAGERRDLSSAHAASMGLLAVGCLALGVMPGLLFSFLPDAAVAYAKPFAQKQFTKAGAVLLVGLVAFALVRKPLSHVTPVPDLDVVYRRAGPHLLAVATAGAARVDAAIHALEAAIATGARWVVAGEQPGVERARRWMANPAAVGASVALLALLVAVVLVATVV
ncbi:proton-conducting transporter transmembrane domain-containing protein [Halarchaeum sp. P4]|uniref:proton-conducting transporter transmembrane domain-containing protein n=1 Tax=Halarchaeum sp. P4 TaxID=3421639 RepID=UPI003EBF1DBB